MFPRLLMTRGTHTELNETFGRELLFRRTLNQQIGQGQPFLGVKVRMLASSQKITAVHILQFPVKHKSGKIPRRR